MTSAQAEHHLTDLADQYAAARAPGSGRAGQGGRVQGRRRTGAGERRAAPPPGGATSVGAGLPDAPLPGACGAPYCHSAGSWSGLVSSTLQSWPASTSIVGRVSRARPMRGLTA